MKDFKRILAGFDQKLLYKLGGFFCAYVFIICLGILPSFHKVVELRQQRRENSEARLRALGSAKTVSQLSQDSLKLRGLIEKMAGHLPRKKETNALLGTISEAAADVGVKIIEIKPREGFFRLDADAGLLCESEAFELNLEADYHALGEFAASLETGKSLIRILKLHISPTKSEAIHQATLVIALISKKQDLAKALGTVGL